MYVCMCVTLCVCVYVHVCICVGGCSSQRSLGLHVPNGIQIYNLGRAQNNDSVTGHFLTHFSVWQNKSSKFTVFFVEGLDIL